jgi:hypothetical protein
MRSIQITFFFLLSLAMASCQNPPTDLEVPYGENPEIPAQATLETLATLDFKELEDEPVEINAERKQHFYRLKGEPYTGWAKHDLLAENQRMRYIKIDSGYVVWQIGYFDNGNPDCDFHALNGLNHGSQRMWKRDGQPYIDTYSLNDVPSGTQRRWHPNGQLEWKAVYENGVNIEEVFYSPEGEVTE